MKSKNRAGFRRPPQRRTASAINEIFRAALKALCKWSFYDQFAVGRLVQAHDIADISEGQQAADRMKAIGTRRPDMQVEVDLGRREAGTFALA
jgi:hypothetical protein